MALYTLMRVGLVAVLTLVLAFVIQMPLLVALLLAIILQLPLSMMLFSGQQRKVAALVGARTAVRRGQRAELRKSLLGDDTP